MATKDHDPCREKAADSEPLFTLRAHDQIAPDAVDFWADVAFALGAPEEKVAEARACADGMREWQREHGCKVPD